MTWRRTTASDWRRGRGAGADQWGAAGRLPHSTRSGRAERPSLPAGSDPGPLGCGGPGCGGQRGWALWMAGRCRRPTGRLARGGRQRLGPAGPQGRDQGRGIHRPGVGRARRWRHRSEHGTRRSSGANYRRVGAAAGPPLGGVGDRRWGGNRRSGRRGPQRRFASPERVTGGALALAHAPIVLGLEIREIRTRDAPPLQRLRRHPHQPGGRVQVQQVE